jgi:hypothetical protein
MVLWFPAHHVMVKRSEASEECTFIVSDMYWSVPEEENLSVLLVGLRENGKSVLCKVRKRGFVPLQVFVRLSTWFQNPLQTMQSCSF